MPRLRPILSVLALTFFVSLSCFAAQAAARPSRPKLQPCKVQGDGGEIDALCGQYQVWENRQAKAGRKISLKIVVIPALGPNPQPDPIVVLGGGPGQAATTMTGIPGLARDRDLLFVDQRGTGDPGRLQCLLGTPGDLQSFLEELFPLDAVRRCRKQLGKKYGLTLYTTAAGADDLDEVRAWPSGDRKADQGLAAAQCTRSHLPTSAAGPSPVSRTASSWRSPTRATRSSTTVRSGSPRPSSTGRASRGSTPRASRR